MNLNKAFIVAFSCKFLGLKYQMRFLTLFKLLFVP